MMTTTNTAVATVNVNKPVGNDLRTLAQYLEARKADIAQAAARHVSADRLARIVLNCVARTPALRNCTMVSIYRSAMMAAELGLDPGSALGECYLLPYKDQCQLIVGYRGLITLARRSGEVETVQAFVVYEGDDFEVKLGTLPEIVHNPRYDGDRDPSKVRYVYAVAKLRGTETPMFDVMTRSEVEAVRRRSKSGAAGPWETDWAEMARKTVVRRLAKYLPMSVEMAKAVSLDAGEGESYTPAVLEGDVDPATGEVIDGAPEANGKESGR
jgi:recombination protein RecT